MASLKPTGGWEPAAFVDAGDGWVIAGETSTPVAGQPSPRAVWARLDAKATLRWERVAPDAGSASAVIARGDGFLVAGRTNPSGANDDAWWSRLDAQGNGQWQRSADGGGQDAALGMVLGTDGDLISVGRGSDKGGATGLLARGDAFGHLSCGAAGGCATKKWSDCDDDKPCTADHCHGSKGCLNTPVDDFVCDPKDGCATEGICTKGGCPPGPKGKLFSATYAHSPAWRFVGAVADPDGGVATLAEQDDFDGSDPRKVWLDPKGAEFSPRDALIVGNEDAWIAGDLWGGSDEAKSKRNGVVLALDGSGAQQWRTVLNERNANGLVALAATPAGQVVAGGWRERKGVRQPWLVGLSSKGQVVWHGGPTAGPATQPTSLVALADGALVLTGVQRKGLLDQGWMGRFDGAGSLIAEQLVQTGTAAGISAHGALGLADHTVLLTGHATVDGGARGLLARADRWGHTSCAASAGCLLKTAKTCADNDACTAERCQAGACIASPATCSEGDPCTLDTCKGGCAHKGGCDDSAPCTRDLCDPYEGCVHTKMSGCQGADACQVPVCTGATCDGLLRNGTCYSVPLGGVGNRVKAADTCAASGRTLASVHDAATTAVLVDLVREAMGKDYAGWIGLTKKDQTTPWAWDDGSPTDYSGMFAYKPFDPLAAKYKGLDAYINNTGLWCSVNAGSNSAAAPICMGLTQATCKTAPAPDGTACGSGKTCKAGGC